MPIPPAKRRERKLLAEGWKRSIKGNLWKRICDEDQEVTITIFSQDDGFKWCLHDGQPRFSEEQFGSETQAIEDAMLDLYDEIIDEYEV